MAREAAISVYLLFFRLVFNLCKLFPQKKKTVCVASFGDNIFYTTRSLRSLSDEDIIFLKTPSCNYPFDSSIGTVIPFTAKHPIAYVRSIYHLATASTILVDNYFGFLAVTNFKKETICIQLWHAVGASKLFGLMDFSIYARSLKSKERFQMVYNRFHYTVVGSERMATIFRKSFGISADSILRTGIPRTDIFFNKSQKEELYQTFMKKYPRITDKKIVLYAPTFRDKELRNYRLKLDIEKLYRHLSEEYVLFIKLHPAVSYTLNEGKIHDFVFDVSMYPDTNELLLLTDVLITDYSSIPYEFALLQKPMIFFAYDMEEYQRERGLLEDFTEQMPGPIVSSTEDIVTFIKQNRFDMHEIKTFANQWNEYSNGDSSLRLAQFLTGTAE